MHCGDRCKALCGHRARLREHLFSLLQLAGIQQLLRQRLVKVDAQAHGDLHGAPPLAPGTARTLLTAARAEDAAPSQTSGALPEDPTAAKEPGAARGTGGRRWKPDPLADPDAAPRPAQADRPAEQRCRHKRCRPPQACTHAGAAGGTFPLQRKQGAAHRLLQPGPVQRAGRALQVALQNGVDAGLARQRRRRRRGVRRARPVVQQHLLQRRRQHDAHLRVRERVMLCSARSQLYCARACLLPRTSPARQRQSRACRSRRRQLQQEPDVPAADPSGGCRRRLRLHPP